MCLIEIPKKERLEIVGTNNIQNTKVESLGIGKNKLQMQTEKEQWR